MDNIQFWIYVIIVVVTLIARSGKKKPKPFDSKPDDYAPEIPENKPISFEDLLREIQEAKSPKPGKSAEPVLKPVLADSRKAYDFEDYDDNLEDETKSLETPSYDSNRDDEIYETYEKAKQAAFLKPSLEETLKVEDTEVKFGQFNVYKKEHKESVAAMIKRDLADKQNFKKAFILSEILNRRY